MITIILPGYSPRNKDWAEELASELKLGHDVIVHNWEHWRTGKSMSVRREMDKIEKEAGEDKFNIIGKSVGARMAIRVMAKFKSQVEKLILCGIASVSSASQRAYEKTLVDFPPDKIVIFQNTNDPFVPYSEVKKFVGSINSKIKIIKKPGDKHHYPYPKDFQKFLKK